MTRRTLLVVLFAVALATVGFGQGTPAGQGSPVGQGIRVGGPLPDNSRFTEKLKDPKAVEDVKKQYVVRKVAGNVYVIAGSGNVVVQAGPDGLLQVDTGYQAFHSTILEQTRKISDKPIRMLFTTHSHPDHHQNNVEYAKQGALLFMQPATRAAQMQLKDPTGLAPYPSGGLGVVTSAWPMSLHFNGEEIAYVPMKTTEVPGEIALYFRGSDVWAFGDVYIQEYRGASIQNGSTMEDVIDNYNLALQMTTPNTIFVPGHGQLADRETITAHRDAISTVHTRVLDMVKKGMTLEQVVAAKPSQEFDARFAPENVRPNTPATAAGWLRGMYNEARGHLGQP